MRSSQGFFTVQQTCPQCSGSGEEITNPCNSCSGQGKTQASKRLSVTIPKGVDDGTRIRLSGKGEAGSRGASSGDLYLFINVNSHELFKWAEKNYGKSAIPKWNFHKILINKEGKIEETYNSFTKPMSKKITSKIESLL